MSDRQIYAESRRLPNTPRLITTVWPAIFSSVASSAALVALPVIQLDSDRRIWLS